MAEQKQEPESARNEKTESDVTKPTFNSLSDEIVKLIFDLEKTHHRHFTSSVITAAVYRLAYESMAQNMDADTLSARFNSLSEQLSLEYLLSMVCSANLQRLLQFVKNEIVQVPASTSDLLSMVCSANSQRLWHFVNAEIMRREEVQRALKAAEMKYYTHLDQSERSRIKEEFDPPQVC